MQKGEYYYLRNQRDLQVVFYQANMHSPRKIKSIIEPLGFELKNNRITAKEGDDIYGRDENWLPIPPFRSR
ncbi:hypothetical protein PG994_005089 [Apiospora phragmitis]|uniref:Uncharacterized protein n=1 Tax=Apiospora phragmitis TaxID=2905665 RepID=A0ABR1VSF5_9PEZI